MTDCSGVLFNINSQLTQRRRSQLLYTAEPRYDNLKNSPYLIGFTQQQLNMKRKVEILKYASNTQSNQTNNPTKKQQYANLVKGSISKPSNLTQNNTCPNDIYLPTLTSACDVPGKIITLQNDPSVPLYLYGFNTDATYSNYEQVINPSKWTIYDLSDNTFFNNTEKLELILYIQGGIDKSYYNYTINTPISIYIQGDISSNYLFNKNGNIIVDSSNIEVVLNNIVLNVYYNTNIIYTEKIILNNTTDLSNSLLFDLSGSTNVINNNKFFGSLFIGNLNISNILLNTTNGTIYDLKISANFNNYITPIYINNLNVGIVANITSNYTYISNNCNIKGSPSIIQNPFSIIGI